MKTFDYIQDPSHGWIKAPILLLAELEVLGSISSFSYIRGAYVYLEEDCDATVFINAFNARYGFNPKLKSKVARNKQSKIRSYDQFNRIHTICHILGA